MTGLRSRPLSTGKCTSSGHRERGVRLLTGSEGTTRETEIFLSREQNASAILVTEFVITRNSLAEPDLICWSKWLGGQGESLAPVTDSREVSVMAL